MDGFVLKKSGILGTWNKRWLLLKGLDFKMYNDDPFETAGPVKYEFVVQDVSYPVKSQPAPGRHYFTIHHASADEEPMELAVDDDAAFLRWQGYLSAQIAQAAANGTGMVLCFPAD